jgi:hypothetical protein
MVPERPTATPVGTTPGGRPSRKAPLNAFEIAFPGRLTQGRK